MKRRWLVVLVSLLATAPAARAGGLYLGASVGSSSVKLEAPTQVNFDETGYKAFVGYRVLRYLAVEAGYTDFGNPSESFGTARFESDLEVGALWAVGILPATPRLSLFGRVGYASWDLETRVTAPPEPARSSESSGQDLGYGFGIAYNVTPRLGLQLEWENYSLPEVDEVTFASVGLRWTF